MVQGVQSKQDVTQGRVKEADVICAFQSGGQTCVQVFFYRAGQNWGNQAYFPRHDKEQTVDEVLTAFISQFYDNKHPPKKVYINTEIHQKDLLQDALTLKAERNVVITRPQRGDTLLLTQMVEKNAREAL